MAERKQNKFSYTYMYVCTYIYIYIYIYNLDGTPQAILMSSCDDETSLWWSFRYSLKLYLYGFKIFLG